MNSKANKIEEIISSFYRHIIGKLALLSQSIDEIKKALYNESMVKEYYLFILRCHRDNEYFPIKI